MKSDSQLHQPTGSLPIFDIICARRLSHSPCLQHTLVIVGVPSRQNCSIDAVEGKVFLKRVQETRYRW